MSGPRLTSLVKEQIIADYLAGKKIAVIAAKYGVDQSYPRLLSRRRGVAHLRVTTA